MYLLDSVSHNISRNILDLRNVEERSESTIITPYWAKLQNKKILISAEQIEG